MFVEDVFKYVQFQKVKITRDGVLHELTNAFEIWQQIELGHEIVDSTRSAKPRKIRAYKNSKEWREFEALVKSFNDSLKKLIEYINIQAPIHFKQLGYEFQFYLELEKETSFIRKETFYECIPFVLRIHIPEYENQKHVLHKPHSFLNEAKLSAIAIPIRLAILTEKRQANCLKFIILDDLLISLDMRNKEKVLELLLSPEFIDNYQLIILTHDRTFFQMAKHKLAFLSRKIGCMLKCMRLKTHMAILDLTPNLQKLTTKKRLSFIIQIIYLKRRIILERRAKSFVRNYYQKNKQLQKIIQYSI